MRSILLALPFLISAVPGWAADPDLIIQMVETNLNGKTAQIEIAMTVQTRRTNRTMKMVSYSVGNDKSFIKILYPKKDKGITFLKTDGQMWQYVPKIEKIIKIPASMMLQSWMGSDFTNDDLVKESSIQKDYNKKLLSEDENEFKIELLPKENAAVVWGRLVMGVSKKLYLPTTVEYYDEDGQLVRELKYDQVKKFDGRSYPSSWLVIPKTREKAGHQTIIQINNATFDQPIDEAYFSKRALKRFSQ